VDWWVWVLIGVAVVAILGFLFFMSRRQARLRDRFGPEYGRSVERSGSKRKARHELRDRVKRHDELELRPLSNEARTRYSRRWEDIQSEFVDSPERAATDAETLLDRVMADRGYPVGGDFDERADLIAVDEPQLVENYRTAHRYHHDRNRIPTTDDYRAAFVGYRALFVQLLEDGTRDESRTRHDWPEQSLRRDEPTSGDPWTRRNPNDESDVETGAPTTGEQRRSA